MKALSVTSKRSLLVLGFLACLIVASSVSGFAQERENPVMRASYPGETHTGRCCKVWDAAVTIHEPERNVPIIVTFSTDYRSNATFYVGLKLNDGVCTFNGPFVIPAFQPDDWTRTTTTFQWVIMPGDYKLASGLNTLQVCGGGSTSDNDSIELGFYTLSARLQKK